MGAKRITGPYWKKLPGLTGWGAVVPGGAVVGQRVVVTNKRGEQQERWVLAVYPHPAGAHCALSPFPPKAAAASAPSMPASDTKQRVAASLAKPDVIEKARRRACEACGIYCPPPGEVVCRVCRGSENGA